MSKIIVGAGLAGLIAAHYFKDAKIIDAANGPVASHQALLRFRTLEVSALTGIPFKEVTVQKAVMTEDGLSDSCSIADANRYSMKVSGGVRARSIAKLEPSVRYIAPDNFHERLVDGLKDRIEYGTPFDGEYLRSKAGVDFISTAPMSVNLMAAGIDHGAAFKFEKSAIRVFKAKLTCPSDVYQTIYFPARDTNIFRASITGDTLIVETVPLGYSPTPRTVVREALEAFGLEPCAVDHLLIESHHQPFGKIVDMPRQDREALMHELTAQHDIFSLGRFATWRNILLDDVVSDLKAIDRLLSASAYSRKIIMSGIAK